MSDDFTDVGHSVALVLGLLVSTQVARPGPLDAGALRVAGGLLELWVPDAGARHLDVPDRAPPAAGALGALAAEGIARSRMTRRRLPEAG